MCKKIDDKDNDIGCNRNSNKTVTMPISTRAYEYPFKDAIKPTTGAPMHLVQSTIARMHAQQVLSRTNFSHIPPSFLTFKAGNVLLATNQKIPDDTVASFSIAELVSHDVSLQFLVDGSVKTLTGEVYIQFTYFSGTQDAQDFFNIFNAHPPFEFRTASDGIDAYVIAMENSSVYIEFPSDTLIVNNPEISNSYCSSTNNFHPTSPFSTPPSFPSSNVIPTCLAHWMGRALVSHCYLIQIDQSPQST